MSTMQSFTMAFEHAKYLIQVAKQRPSSLLKQVKAEPKWKSLFQKMTDLYVHNASCGHNQGFSHSNILRTLVVKEKLNCLVLNLYPGNLGYKVMLKSRAGIDGEVVDLPYEETELLNYIDNEELPPFLVDIFEGYRNNIFYSGCVIVEIRDYRRSNDMTKMCDPQYTLLKPTTESVICDIGLLTSQSHRWNWEERHALESSILLSTSEPLCLDPSASVAIISNHLQHYKTFLSRKPLKKLATRQTQMILNRKRKFEEQFPSHPLLKLHDYLSQKKKRYAKPFSLRKGIKLHEIPIQNDFNLTESDCDHIRKFTSVVPKPKRAKDNTPVFVEEYVMEIERNEGKIHLTKVTITLTPADKQYHGALCISAEDLKDSCACSFVLGSRSDVDKYVDQFIEIFTEEGRKSVKITHIVSGLPPEVRFTDGAKEKMKNNLPSTSTPPKLSSSFSVESIMSSSWKSDRTINVPQKPIDTSLYVRIGDPDICGSTLQQFQFHHKARSPPTSLSPDSFTMGTDPASPISSNPDTKDYLLSSENPLSFGLPSSLITPNLSLHNLVSIAGMNSPQVNPMSLAIVNPGTSSFQPSSQMMMGSMPGMSTTVPLTIESCDQSSRIKSERSYDIVTIYPSQGR